MEDFVPNLSPSQIIVKLTELWDDELSPFMEPNWLPKEVSSMVKEKPPL